MAEQHPIYEIINEFIRDNNISTGFLPLSLRCGSSKSYNSIKFICDHVSELKKGQYIFFLTSRKNNLSIDSFRNFYKENGREEYFSTEVLELKATMEHIIEVVRANKRGLDGIVPVEFAMNMPNYEIFKNELNKYLKLCNEKTEYAIELRDEVYARLNQELEKNFRADIKNLVRNAENLPKDSLEIRKIILRGRPSAKNDFSWIATLYPAVLLDKDIAHYKIVVTSLHKFIYPIDPIVGSSFTFNSSSILNDSIVFIDEIDSTKEVVNDIIITKAMNLVADYLTIFKKIYVTLIRKQFSSKIQYADARLKDVKGVSDLQELTELAASIWNEFELDYSYKMSNDDIDTQVFLFGDDEFTTICSRKDHKYLCTNKVPEDNNIRIFLAPEKPENNPYDIRELLYRISKFFRIFKRTTAYLTEYYYEKEVSSKQNEPQYIVPDFTKQNARNTIYRALGLEQADIDFLSSSVIDQYNFIRLQKVKNRFALEQTFYKNGFRFFKLSNEYNQNEDTKLNLIDVKDTAEMFLLDLALKVKVVGISATAEHPSVLTNYDLSFLEEYLGEHFYHPSAEKMALLEENFCKESASYYDGTIRVHCEAVQSLMPMEELIHMFGPTNPIVSHLRVLFDMNENGDYILGRYMKIFQVMYQFITNKKIASFLVLTKPLAKVDNDYFSSQVLELAFRVLVKKYGEGESLGKDNLVFLTKEDFAQNKAEMQQRLAAGNRVMCISSYATIGTGQNLNYPIPANRRDKLCCLVPDSCGSDSRFTTKDFDAIYLGDVTNILVSLDINTTDNVNKYEQLLRFIFQAEYLYQQGEISFPHLRKGLANAFQWKSKNPLQLKYEVSGSFRHSVTKEIYQAIGRLCRTYQKEQDIYIYFDSDLTNKIDPSGYPNYNLINPEFAAFLSYIEKCRTGTSGSIDDLKGEHSSPDDAQIVAQQRTAQFQAAQRRGSIRNMHARSYINNFLSRDWTEETMRVWKEMRICSLKHYTADQPMEFGPFMNCYIEAPSSISAYYYVEKYDFKQTILWFGDSLEEFKKYLLDQHSDVYDLPIQKVDFKESRLPIALKVPGLKEEFEKHGFLTEPTAGKWIMSPVFYRSIFLGAIGEICGKYILEKELNITLHEIKNPDQFEYMDYTISDSIFIDFKNWSQNYMVDGQEMREKIIHKLDAISEDAIALIINLNWPTGHAWVSYMNRIYEFPGLLNEFGTINHDVLRKISDLVLERRLNHVSQ